MFTGVIKLAQIDDYINPSQSCIKPQIMKPDLQMKKATVSLNDCLACSGCITSAQSILVEQMSLQKLLSKMDSKGILPNKGIQQICIFISPQSILSLSKHFQLEPSKLMNVFSKFFAMYYPSVQAVLNMNVAISICHQLIWEQYLQVEQRRTILCSQCPGWVCYAQKTLTQSITKLMSKVKSPQQLLGRMLKKITKKQRPQNSCYVVGVMPCYDKKLEAIRFDFEDQKQVDLTITTGQLLILIEQTLKRKDLSWQKWNENLNEKQQDDMEINEKSFAILNSKLSFLEDSTSNGYINFILQKLNVKWEIEEIKNTDFIQYKFTIDGKERKMAKCYGFRNIQKIVQSIKKQKCPYEYIEIMACPGGCFGGGGQIKVQNLKVKQLINQLKDIAKNNHQESVFNMSIQSTLQPKQTRAQYHALQNSVAVNVNNW